MWACARGSRPGDASGWRAVAWQLRRTRGAGGGHPHRTTRSWPDPLTSLALQTGTGRASGSTTPWRAEAASHRCEQSHPERTRRTDTRPPRYHATGALARTHPSPLAGTQASMSGEAERGLSAASAPVRQSGENRPVGARRGQAAPAALGATLPCSSDAVGAVAVCRRCRPRSGFVDIRHNGVTEWRSTFRVSAAAVSLRPPPHQPRSALHPPQTTRRRVHRFAADAARLLAAPPHHHRGIPNIARSWVLSMTPPEEAPTRL